MPQKLVYKREFNFNRELCVPTFFEKFYLERCNNLANNESRNPAGFYWIIPQSRGIEKTRDLVNCSSVALLLHNTLK